MAWEAKLQQGALDSQAYAAAPQPDDKIVEVGGLSKGFLAGFGLARFNPDGSPDMTFGNGGTVNTMLGTPTNAQRATAVAIQGDGRIVVAGINNLLELARYNADGSLRRP